jgi:RIO-like serine/threonine protein kinase
VSTILQINEDLSPEEWRILEFHKDRTYVSSEEIQQTLSLEARKVSESLHNLHYEGLIYFGNFIMRGNFEKIVSRITEKGFKTLKGKPAFLESRSDQ